MLDHLRHCVDVARTKVDLEERCGWEHLEHAETDGAVQVTVRDPDGRIETLRIKRLLAAGLEGAKNTLRSQIWQNTPREMAKRASQNGNS